MRRRRDGAWYRQTDAFFAFTTRKRVLCPERTDKWLRSTKERGTVSGGRSAYFVIPEGNRRLSSAVAAALSEAAVSAHAAHHAAVSAHHLRGDGVDLLTVDDERAAVVSRLLCADKDIVSAPLGKSNAEGRRKLPQSIRSGSCVFRKIRRSLAGIFARRICYSGTSSREKPVNSKNRSDML